MQILGDGTGELKGRSCQRLDGWLVGLLVLIGLVCFFGGVICWLVRHVVDWLIGLLFG